MTRRTQHNIIFSKVVVSKPFFQRILKSFRVFKYTSKIFATTSLSKIIFKPMMKRNVGGVFPFPIGMFISFRFFELFNGFYTWLMPNFKLCFLGMSLTSKRNIATFFRTKLTFFYFYSTLKSPKIFFTIQTLFNHIFKNPAFKEYESFTNGVINKIKSLVQTKVLYINLINKSI